MTSDEASSSASSVARAYLQVARWEGEEEALLDEVGLLERRIRLLRNEVSCSADISRRRRSETEAARNEAQTLRAQAQDEEKRRDKFQAQLLKGRSNAEADADCDAILGELIRVKTELAQVTEEKERQNLERKHLEDQLAKAKFHFADVITSADDSL